MNQVEVKLSDILDTPQPNEITDKMIKIDIIYNQGQIMATGYGSSRDQAEKNASINGLLWLQQNKQQEIEQVLKNSMFS